MCQARLISASDHTYQFSIRLHARDKKVLRCARNDFKISVPDHTFQFQHVHRLGIGTGAPNGNFRENICSEDDLRSRIFGAFVVKFLACEQMKSF